MKETSVGECVSVRERVDFRVDNSYADLIGTKVKKNATASDWVITNLPEVIRLGR